MFESDLDLGAEHSVPYTGQMTARRARSPRGEFEEHTDYGDYDGRDAATPPTALERVRAKYMPNGRVIKPAA